MANDFENIATEAVLMIYPLLHETMEDELADYVEDVLLEHIEHDIYDAYTPKHRGWGWYGGDDSETYHRRHVLEKEVKSTIETGDGLYEYVLSTTSNADANRPVLRGYTWEHEDGGFLDMLEQGRMGFWGYMPRPAVTNADDELERNEGKIIDIVVNGISRRLDI